MDKKSLRREYLRIRAGLSAYTRGKADQAIIRTVEGLAEFRNAGIVAGYVTDGTEHDVLPLIRKALKKGRRACLPKWNGNEYILSFVDEEDLATLAPGKWGLMEPVSTRPAEEYIPAGNVLFLVPGVAFDDGLNRLGRGGGIYDRILNGRGCATALGIFYECQQCLVLPTERHDVRLDLIVTEAAVRRCEKQASAAAGAEPGAGRQMPESSVNEMREIL